MTFFQGRRDRLDAFRRGDREVLAELFHHYVDDVALVLRRGFLVRNARVGGVNDRDKERELTQEVFVRALSERARLSYDGVSPYRPYLTQIARNLLIDLARAAGTVVERVSADELAELPSLEPDPDEVLQNERLNEATRAFCAELPERLRRFVTLRFEEGRSQRDVAEALGVTRRQVRTWEAEVGDGLAAALRARGLLENTP